MQCETEADLLQKALAIRRGKRCELLVDNDARCFLVRRKTAAASRDTKPETIKERVNGSLVIWSWKDVSRT